MLLKETVVGEKDLCNLGEIRGERESEAMW